MNYKEMDNKENSNSTSIPSENVKQMAQKTKSNAFLVFGIIFVAFNLRPAITSVGPIINDIQSSLHFSTGMAGFVTTLPLLAFAVISPIAATIGRRIGHASGIFLGLLILFAGILIRAVSATVPLFIGTVCGYWCSALQCLAAEPG